MGETGVAVGCVHHWLLDAPSGPKIAAECRRCGARREFPAVPAEKELTAFEMRAMKRLRNEERMVSAAKFDLSAGAMFADADRARARRQAGRKPRPVKVSTMTAREEEAWMEMARTGTLKRLLRGPDHEYGQELARRAG